MTVPTVTALLPAGTATWCPDAVAFGRRGTLENGDQHQLAVRTGPGENLVHAAGVRTTSTLDSRSGALFFWQPQQGHGDEGATPPPFESPATETDPGNARAGSQTSTFSTSLDRPAVTRLAGSGGTVLAAQSFHALSRSAAPSGFSCRASR